MCENYFFRFRKWRNIFRFLILTDSKKTNQVKRDLSACIPEKFTRYSIVRSKYKNKERVLFTLIDIIFDPMKKKTKIKINCYFTTHKHLAYKITFIESNKVKHSKAYECYHCLNFYLRKDKHEKHIKSCSGIPDILYKFQNQNLITFQGYLKYKGDLPFIVYYDFETTTTTEYMFD